MTKRKQLVVGNWKMNHTLSDITHFFSELEDLKTQQLQQVAWIAPQALHISKLIELSQEKFLIGAQNCAAHTSGALTGEISPQALKDVGAHFVLIGHSERRSLYHEDNASLRQKVVCAMEHNLVVIYCVGETLEQREQGKTQEVIQQQLEEGLQGLKGLDHNNLIIAYEPVWAIGTGKTASPEEAQEVHQQIRSFCGKKLALRSEELTILYGGSVKPSNFQELLNQTDIDGGLIGGASLNPLDFKALCQIALG